MQIRHKNRKAFALENAELRVVITAEGGHVAEIRDKATGINPLWEPPWPSIEPSAYSKAANPEYGDSAEAGVIAGMLGHSICLDTYGGPSAEEFAAGMPVHGEGPVVAYDVKEEGSAALSMSAVLPLAEIRFTRRLVLAGSVLRFEEEVENLTSCDRPIAWTQHVTLGAPYVEHGKTEFRMPATQSSVMDQDYGGYLKPGARFEWPLCPRRDGGIQDLRRYTSEAPTGGFTTHLADPRHEQAHFVAWHPGSQLAFGYAWKRSDFPWVCRWEENGSRKDAPWNGKTVNCAMEFGVSPTVESRRAMVTRGTMFGEAAYRWLPARATLKVSYCAFAQKSAAVPSFATWDEGDQVRLS